MTARHGIRADWMGQPDPWMSGVWRLVSTANTAPRHLIYR